MEIQNLKELSKLTVLIFTKDRPGLLCGLLKYWSTTNSQIVVLDASEENYTRLLSESYGAQYYWGPSFADRAHFAKNFIHTTFACINMDDDVILKSGAAKAIEFLKERKESIGIGRVRDFNEMYFNKINKSIVKSSLHIEAEPEIRLRKWSSYNLAHELPWYSVWRTEALTLALESSVPPFSTAEYADKFATVGFRIAAAALGRFDTSAFDIYLKRKHFSYFHEEFESPKIRELHNSVVTPKRRLPREISIWSNNAAVTTSGFLNKPSTKLKDAFEFAWESYDQWDSKRNQGVFKIKFLQFFIRRGIERLYIVSRKSPQEQRNILLYFVKLITRSQIRILFVIRNFLTIKRIPWGSNLLKFNKDLQIFYDSGMIPKKQNKTIFSTWSYGNLSPVDTSVSAPVYKHAKQEFLLYLNLKQKE